MKSPLKPSITLLAIAVFCFQTVCQPVFAGEPDNKFLDLDLADLLSVNVTSVSRKEQPWTEAAAAIFVITQDDILRAGVTSIPEALRLAPGLQVARIDGNKWAISSRGFNAQFANKLLVMVDGRSVYTPSFSGVYWEVQDFILQDIDRIEVIRGPGATLWGANAVNGVINIITKQARMTQGGLLVVGGGNEEKGFASFRFGSDLGEDVNGQFYLKHIDRASNRSLITGGDARDDWARTNGGFRFDGMLSPSDRWTLQGGAYSMDGNQNVNGLFQDPADPASSPPYRVFDSDHPIDSSGWNFLGLWERTNSAQSSTKLQIYYDRTRRRDAIIGQSHHIFDIDLSRQWVPRDGHEVIWGLGYRHTKSSFDNTFSVAVLPEKDSIDLFSAFVQDEIELVPDQLRITLGAKLEHNDYTGNEFQPSVRLVWLPRERQTFWASISKAARTPSQVEHGSRITTEIIPLGPPPIPPLVLSLRGDGSLLAEELTAFESGYRLQPTEAVSVDVSAFLNDYENLMTFEVLGQTGVFFGNKRHARSRGVELVLEWHLKEWWDLQASYSYLTIDETTSADSTDVVTADVVEGASPRHQSSLRSGFEISEDWTLDFWVYFVGELSATTLSASVASGVVSDYVSLNGHLTWRPKKNLQVSLTAHNLQDSHHLEFVGENIIIPTEIERSVYAQVLWEF